MNALLSGDDERAEASVSGFERSGSQAIPLLQAALRTADVDARWWIFRAFAAIAHPGIAEILCQGLKDVNNVVRQVAALGLRSHPNEAAIPDLLTALDSEDRLLARLAGDALIAIGGAAVPGLLERTEAGFPSARLEAARALAEIGDPRAIPFFFNAVKDGDTRMVEYWAEHGLAKLGVGMTFFKP